MSGSVYRNFTDGVEQDPGSAGIRRRALALAEPHDPATSAQPGSWSATMPRRTAATEERFGPWRTPYSTTWHDRWRGQPLTKTDSETGDTGSGFTTECE